MQPRTEGDIYITRLRMLRDVAVPFIRQVDREGGLDFNVYMDDWKLKGCMLGWMAVMPCFQADGWAMLRGGFPSWTEPNGRWEIGFRAAQRYFGLSKREAFDIFGVDNARSTVHSECPTLEGRIARIDGIIEERSRNPQPVTTGYELEPVRSSVRQVIPA